MLLDRVEDVVDEEAVRLQADRVDHRVGPDAAGHLHQRLETARLLEVDHLGAEPPGELEPVRDNGRSRSPARRPSASALCTANSPTGPQPQTATVSPGSMSAFSAAIQPVGRMSERNSTLLVVEPVAG